MNVVARRASFAGARHIVRSRTTGTAALCARSTSAAVPVSPFQQQQHSENASQTRSLWTMANRPRLNRFDTTALGQRPGAPEPQIRHPSLVGQQTRTFVGPFARIIAQVAATGAVVFGKAFAQAFAQAQANAKNPKAAAQNMGLHKKEMDVGQAYEVLNLSPGASQAEVEEQFEKYFAANDPDNGGSFYLQSKVFQAKNSILKELNGGDNVYTEQELKEDKEQN